MNDYKTKSKKLKVIYFIRHGESEHNARSDVKPNKDIELTELGIAQSNRIAEELRVKPNAIYISDMKRTWQTAEKFSKKNNLKPRILPFMNEITNVSHVSVEKLSVAERETYFDNYWERCDHLERNSTDCDTFEEFYYSIDKFFEYLPNIPTNSVCFGHGMWMSLLVWRVLGFSDSNNLKKDMELYRKFQMGLPMTNTALYRFIWDENLGFENLRYIQDFAEITK